MLPTFYIPHGGGPCFFMDDPQGTWLTMAAFLRGLPQQLPTPPSAILIVSGHWETRGFSLTAATSPPLVYDYYGFPAHTYELQYPAPGQPVLAEQAAELLRHAGFTASLDQTRGLDHGVFVPLKVVYPEAQIPVVELSLDASLDAALHIAAGKALAPLRDQGVLIMGAGMSFHNLRAYGDPRAAQPSQQFDDWLNHAATSPSQQRNELLANWHAAPAARICHPRHEHLLPMMVAAGAAQGQGQRLFNDQVLGSVISGFRFE
jgi:aromatic ring-opening dioxygenase catalytic subunit (LigB family)